MLKLLIILSILFCWGCANQVPPTGGPKDEDPPQLLSSTPANADRNVEQNIITLTFDEIVVTKSIKEQLIITPRIDFDYEYKIKKSTITFEFEEAFADSTTYTFNFREGLVDLTEGNSAEDMVIAFSTGPLLDTLQISGEVIDLMTGKPVEKVVVGIYEDTDTSDLFTNEPLYFTNTQKDGSYLFRNIKDGNYRIYAFVDNNKDLICQSDREPYAFYSEVLKLDTSLVLRPLTIQHLNVDTLKVNRVQQTGHYVNLIANKYLLEARLSANTPNPIRFKYTEEQKALRIYNTFEIGDSLLVAANLKDSTGTELDYQFYLKFPETTRRKDEFKAQLSTVTASIEHKLIRGSFEFDKPIRFTNLDSIRIERDSTMVIMLKELIQFSPDSTHTTYNFEIPMPQDMMDSLISATDPKPTSLGERKPTRKKGGGRKYAFLVPRGTFYSIEGDTTENIVSQIGILVPKLLGVIHGSVHTSYESYEIQLITEKFEIIKKTHPGKNYRFTEVRPGEYLIRILVDSNNNGRWDPGDIRKGEQPEPVIIYTDPSGSQKTSIRANWEMTLDLFF